MKISIKGVIIPNDYQRVYDWFGWECTCPNAVSTALQQANGQDVDVEINSGGGDVFAGSEIYTALRNYPGNVKVHIVGIAASAASVIAMAGKSDMSPTAQLMVHNVSSYAEGDTNDMQHMADVLANANKAIAAAYVEKSGMSEADALVMMDRETWLTAQQAADLKLVDSVMFAESGQPRGIQLAASADRLISRDKMDALLKLIDTDKAESIENLLNCAMAQYNYLDMESKSYDKS